MKITITFRTENSAFVDDYDAEIEHILKQVKAHLKGCDLHTALRDSNGNTIGRVDKEFLKRNFKGV